MCQNDPSDKEYFFSLRAIVELAHYFILLVAPVAYINGGIYHDFQV